MTKAHAEEIQQIFFSWSHDGPGLTVFAHSFTDPADAKRWQHLLSSHLRLQPVGGFEPPKTALSYLDFNGYAAVLRRVDTGYSSGRNNSHALIGPVDVLSAPVALGLSRWTGWLERTVDRMLPRFFATDVCQFADEDAHLRTRALAIEPNLRTVLARLIEKPNEPLSVIGCPDNDRLAMVWGLRAAAEDYLCQVGVRRRWTFSTYENKHDVSTDNLPEIVFLPTNQAGAPVVHRTIVDLQRPVERRGNQDLASQLLASALRGVAPVPVPAILQSPEIQKTHEMQRPTPQQEPAQDNSPTPAQTTPPHQNGQQHPAKALAMTTSVREFEKVLSQLELLARFPDNRKVTRDVLTASIVNSISALVEDKARQELYVRLLRATYGPNLEDLHNPEAAQHATNVVLSSESELLARLVIQAGHRAGGVAKLDEAGLDRWMAGNQPTTPAVGRRGEWQQKTRRVPRAHLRLAVAIAAVTVLGLVFLLGMRVGEPDTDTTSAPPSEPATPVTAPATTQTEAAVTTVPAVEFAVKDDAGQTTNKWVVAFLRSGDVYLPQSLCEKGEGVWRCGTNGTHETPVDVRAEPVARPVPVRDLPKLMRQALQGGTAQPAEDWGDPLPAL